MQNPKQHSRCSNYLLLLFILFQKATEIYSEDCQLYHSDKILDCGEINTFPNGTYETVEMIKFSRNNFTELKSYIFVNHSFYNLEKAILRHSHIQHIYPHAFHSMSQLTYLDLHGNNITVLDNNSFSGLGLLKHLQLGRNQISTINETILKPLVSLESLDLTFNRINNFPPNLFQNTSILDLKLSGNLIQLSKKGYVLKSHSLLKLSLRSCALKELPQESFKLLPELIYVDLSENFLKILPDHLLKPLVRLESLNIRHNYIMSLDIYKLPIGNHMKVLLCGKNPLEQFQNCSTILREIKFRKENQAENTSFEPKRVDTTQMLKSSLIKKKTDNGVYKIDKLQFKWMIGLSITLIIMVIILSIQALYIVKQGKLQNKKLENRHTSTLPP